MTKEKKTVFLYVGKVTACFNYVDDGDDDHHHQRENEKKKKAVFVHVSVFVLRLIEGKKRE